MHNKRWGQTKQQHTNFWRWKGPIIN